MKPKEIDINKVCLDGETQSRVKLSEDTIDEYADAMTEGAEFPPIEVWYDGEVYWPSDGFHRWRGAKKAGFGTVLAIVHSGTKEDAQWASYAANQLHGLRRTNADKRRAVASAILHSTGRGMTDHAIAEHCGVSQPFVSKCRVELMSGDNGYQVRTRTGRDGKQYPAGKLRQTTEPEKWDASESNEIRNEEPDWSATDDDEPVFTDDDWTEAETQESRLKAAKAPYLRSLKLLKDFHESIVGIIESDDPGCAWLDERSRGGWKFDVDKLAGQIRLVMPEVACPRCEAKGCETCRESGFVSRRLVNRLKDAGKL